MASKERASEAKKLWAAITIVLGIAILIKPDILAFIVTLFLIVKGVLDLV